MEEKSKYFVKRETRNSSKITARSKPRSSKQKIQIKYEDTSIIEAKKVKVEINESDTWYPDNWETVLKNIKEMRRERTAVVDLQGCERTADKNETVEVSCSTIYHL